MLQKSLEQEICVLFKRVLKNEELELDLTAPLKEYGINSIKAVKLLSNLEVHFDIDISEEQAQTITTLEDVVNIVDELSQNPEGMS